MPLYEYQCNACEKRFERIQKYADPPIDTCPSCGAAVRKLFSSPAIQFKGSGFYINDYAKKPASGGDGKSGQDGSGNASEKSSEKSDKASDTSSGTSSDKSSDKSDKSDKSSSSSSSSSSTAPSTGSRSSSGSSSGS